MEHRRTDAADGDFADPKESAPEFGTPGSPEAGDSVITTSPLLTAASPTAPRPQWRQNLALHRCVLIQGIIDSKLQGDDGPKDDEIAEIIGCKGWAPRGKRPRQIKRFHRGRSFQILPAYTLCYIPLGAVVHRDDNRRRIGSI
ncbi:hypothetical protein B0H67DRAFT_91942 [Lasiosphaeris hirsuta]|uniref:Uncharacterized protein n=1 Tax=Lasiosphaeris hirsuta TaxID=260670 RepID=A0AA40BD46_9PEZI|nr:hypothetical protein B0H67DRAFT_91942 [Lasiosphaeris hirsuta]